MTYSAVDALPNFISLLLVALTPWTDEITGYLLTEHAEKDGFGTTQVNTIKAYSSYSSDMILLFTSLVIGIANLSYLMVKSGVNILLLGIVIILALVLSVSLLVFNQFSPYSLDEPLEELLSPYEQRPFTLLRIIFGRQSLSVIFRVISFISYLIPVLMILWAAWDVAELLSSSDLL